MTFKSPWIAFLKGCLNRELLRAPGTGTASSQMRDHKRELPSFLSWQRHEGPSQLLLAAICGAEVTAYSEDQLSCASYSCLDLRGKALLAQVPRAPLHSYSPTQPSSHGHHTVLRPSVLPGAGAGPPRWAMLSSLNGIEVEKTVSARRSHRVSFFFNSVGGVLTMATATKIPVAQKPRIKNECGAPGWLSR